VRRGNSVRYSCLENKVVTENIWLCKVQREAVEVQTQTVLPYTLDAGDRSAPRPAALSCILAAHWTDGYVRATAGPGISDKWNLLSVPAFELQTVQLPA